MSAGKPDALIGRVFAGRYTIESKLGAGGFGSVYRARQHSVDRLVALKVIRGHLADDPGIVKRFHREMKATARIEHPNTIRVYDFGHTDDGELFLAMELLDGDTLTGALKKAGPMPAQRVAAIGAQIAEALNAAHSEGIVHRDLKPDNVILMDRYGRADQVKVLDFGIARFSEKSPDAESLTATGMIMGTPSYMSPEQVTGKNIDHRSDLYALGIVLFRLVTGKVPFTGDTPVQVIFKHVHDPAPAPSQVLGRTVAPWLEALICDLLHKDPSKRPQTARQVVDRLTAGPGSQPAVPAIAPDDTVMLAEEAPPADTVYLASAQLKRPSQAELAPDPPPDPEPAVPDVETPPQTARGAEKLVVEASDNTNWVRKVSNAPMPVVTPEPPAQDSSGGPPWAIVAAVVVLALAGVAVWVATGNDKGASEAPAAAKTESPEPTAQPRAEPPPKPARKSVVTASAPKKAPPKPEPQPRQGAVEPTPTVVQPPPPPPKPAPRPPPEGMVAVAAGDYRIGCLEGDTGCFDDEKPAHTATLKRYAVDVHEVNAGQYDECVAAAACPPAGKGKRCTWQKTGAEQRPITCVSFAAASSYCAYRGGRLPTEPEWEVAARGPKGHVFPWGSAPASCARTVMFGSKKGGCDTGGALTVGARPADKSWVGALDMGGNVREWVAAHHTPYPGGVADTDPTARVNRGGSFVMSAEQLSSSRTRNTDEPGEQRHDLGFRCAQSL